MHLAGVVVRVRPEHRDAVGAQLCALPGVEVHGVNPDGRLAVLIEGEHRGAVSDALFALHALDGVLSASLIYEQSDYEPESTEASP